MEASSLPAPEIEQKLFPRAFQKGRPSAGDLAPGDPPLAPGESTEASDGRTVEAVAGATPPPDRLASVPGAGARRWRGADAAGDGLEPPGLCPVSAVNPRG